MALVVLIAIYAVAGVFSLLAVSRIAQKRNRR